MDVVLGHGLRAADARRIVDCLRRIDLPRFAGIYEIGEGTIVITTGHRISALGYNNAQLLECFRKAVGKLTNRVVIVDLQEQAAFIRPYEIATSFLLLENSSPSPST